LTSELDVKTAEAAELELMKQGLMQKVFKYKEQMAALQDTIKEHQQIRVELEEKLKAEVKISQGKKYFSKD
jgi:hypothetical protein